jgi:hypothetical protein
LKKKYYFKVCSCGINNNYYSFNCLKSYTLNLALKGLRTYLYKETNGNITSFGKEEVQGTEYHDHYFLDLTYYYVVNGEKFENNVYMASERLCFSSDNCREKYIGSMKEVVRVFYDNRNPKNSVLKRGGRSEHLQGLIVCVLVLFLCIFWSLN